MAASDQRKLAKIFKSHSDLLVLDCEDGVALNRKHQARQNIYDLLSSEPRMDDNKFAVRINAPQTELAFEDIKAFFSATTTPRTIFVPKTNHPDDINWLFSSIQKQISPDFPKSLKFFFYMESATSLLNLRELIETANELSSSKHRSLFKLDGFVFGSDDFCADIGAERTRDASELTYARQKLVAHCKAYKLKAIDMVFIDYKDLDGLRTQAEQGARMGFTGKQVIHPGQVDVVQRAFMPSEARIRWARGLVEAFNSHQMSGSVN